MQYTTLALAALLGAAAVASADQQQRQVSAGHLRRLPAASVGKNHPTSQLSRVLQDLEDDHAHEDEDHHDDDEDDEHHEDEDEHEDEDHEVKEMEKLPKWMTEEHHDDEHGEEHGHDDEDEDDEDHDDLETAVAVEGDEDDEHHDDEHEEGKSKCPRFIACIVGTWPRRHKYHI